VLAPVANSGWPDLLERPRPAPTATVHYGADPLQVSSPSFAIIHEYPLPGGPPIVHIDGYRLSDNRREWLEIGIPEILAGPGVKLIEWPKKAFEQFEESHVEITIRVRDDGAREISVA